MKITHFKGTYMWFDKSEAKYILEKYPNFKSCIMRNNKDIVFEYTYSGIEYTLEITSIDGCNFEGEYYKTKHRRVDGTQDIDGKASFKLYKNPVNNKDYLLFGEYAGKEEIGYWYIELTVDKIVLDNEQKSLIL